MIQKLKKNLDVLIGELMSVIYGENSNQREISKEDYFLLALTAICIGLSVFGLVFMN